MGTSVRTLCCDQGVIQRAEVVDYAQSGTWVLPPARGGSAGRLRASTTGPDEADRLGTGPPAIRPEGQIHHRAPARHGGGGSDPARFTRTDVQHRTYNAFAELGKAIKTISSEACREWDGASPAEFRGDL